jgi:SHS2 domain-containing protein
MNDHPARESGQAEFHLLEHPSDIGIEASGPTIREAFEQAALGFTAVIADVDTIEAVDERQVHVDAQDYENLLVRWLSEILYLYDGEDFLVKRVDIKSISPTRITAKLVGEKYEQEKHILKLDVKAITYHQLSIKMDIGTSTVRVFLDI